MRIATTTNTRKKLYEKLNRRLPHILVGTYVNQNRKRYDGVKETLHGGLFDYIYSGESQTWYVRLDGAIGRAHRNTAGLTTTHTQVDDLLFSAGYQQTINKKMNLTCSVLCGVPTHKDHGLEYFQLGTGHFGTGLQLDGMYSFDKNEKSLLLTAVRFIHFFSAKARLTLATGCLSVDLAPGNLIDILIAYNRTWRRHHAEIGYNPGFLCNVHANPSLGDALPSHAIRSSWYATYRYVFIAKAHPMGIGVGTSYGFDHSPKTIGVKQALSFWGSYGINF